MSGRSLSWWSSWLFYKVTVRFGVTTAALMIAGSLR